ncbi:MAG: pseudouridine synthase [Evtepia sp.]
MEERLQKILSKAGVCARRTAETYIQAGRVAVNGKTATLGDKAIYGQDDITVDGKAIAVPEQKTYLMLNKPRGYIATLSDERGRLSVADLVKDCGVRVWPIGRLDYNSEGLLLLTNDGDLTQRLLHPSHEVEKEYLTWVKGNIDQAIPILSAAITLEDGEQFLPAKVTVVNTVGDTSVLSLTIHEGKNRQVRRMCAYAELDVVRLKRIREGALSIDRTLRAGEWRPLKQEEKNLLHI